MPGGVQQLAYPEAVLIKPTSPALQLLSQTLNETTCLLTENRIKNKGKENHYGQIAWSISRKMNRIAEI